MIILGSFDDEALVAWYSRSWYFGNVFGAAPSGSLPNAMAAQTVNFSHLMQRVEAEAAI